MRQVPLVFLLCAGLTANSAYAQPVTAPITGEVRRLSPEEKEGILQGSDGQATDAFLNAARGGGGSRQVHGEVGIMVGSGGARGFFGTALIPLGDRGSAIISIEKSEYGHIRPDRARSR